MAWVESKLTTKEAPAYIGDGGIKARQFVKYTAAGKSTVADETGVDALNRDRHTYLTGETLSVLTEDGMLIMVHCKATDVTVGTKAVIDANGLVVDKGTGGAGTIEVGTIMSLPESISWYQDDTLYTEYFCQLAYKLT